MDGLRMSFSRILAGVVFAAAMAVTGGAAAAEGICPGVAFDLVLDPPNLGYVPYITLDLAGRHGLFMIDTGATLSSANLYVFGDEGSAGEHLRGFSLPGVSEAAFYRRAIRNGPNGQPVLGIIGLDLLIPNVVELHYDDAKPFLVLGSKPCSGEWLSGFVAVDQAGYFSSRPERVATDIADVPVVFLRIGEVSAPAQLDSGFSDAPPGILGQVQANDALLDRLQSGGIATKSAGTRRLTNCEGERIEVDTRTIVDKPLQIVPAIGSGTPLFSYDNAVLQQKPKSDCGGIGGYAQRPFALVGTSYFNNWGTIVIDPQAEKVWLRPRAASP
jgi:hypothetical protein